MIFKPNRSSEFSDWLTEAVVEVVKLETESEHLDRVHQRFLERKQAMGTRHLLHPANQVKRLDGKSYSKPQPDNVRRMRKQAA